MNILEVLNIHLENAFQKNSHFPRSPALSILLEQTFLTVPLSLRSPNLRIEPKALSQNGGEPAEKTQ